MVRKFSFLLVLGRYPRKHSYFTNSYRFENNLYFMKLMLISCIQIGNAIYQKKTHKSHVAVNILDETRYSTSIYHLVTPLWRYNTRSKIEVPIDVRNSKCP